MKLNWAEMKRPIIALSPMADMTDSAFCRLVRLVTEGTRGSNGTRGTEAMVGNLERIKTPQPLSPLSLVSPLSPVVFREMVSSEAVVRGNEKTLGMTDIHPDERPLVQQLFGADPETMARAAAKIEADHHPEGFDINMGCPVYKIVHNFNGCALMKEPELAAKIVREVRAAISVPLSVKIRLGWSNPTDCIEFAKVLEQAGVSLLTVHGRTKTQGYSGKSDWEMIRRVKEAVSIPVLCNGDIHKADLVPQALEVSQCDGVLIARGALGNPWFFAQTAEVLAGRPVPEITLEERMRVIRLHAALHVEQYGERGIVSFRKHLSWYFKGLPHAKLLRENMHTISTLADLEATLAKLTNESVPVANAFSTVAAR